MPAAFKKERHPERPLAEVGNQENYAGWAVHRYLPGYLWSEKVFEVRPGREVFRP